MATKQEPRPAYHRRQDLARLRRLAEGLPVVVRDDGTTYAAWLVVPFSPVETRLLSGRHEVVAAYLAGWRHALGLRPVDPVVASEDAEARDYHAKEARTAFEAWITLPPVEASLRRLDDASSWPGHYADYRVQLAWEAWQAASTWRSEARPSDPPAAP